MYRKEKRFDPRNHQKPPLLRTRAAVFLAQSHALMDVCGMSFQVGLGGEPRVTNLTMERTMLLVNRNLVAPQVRTSGETSVTFGALEKLDFPVGLALVPQAVMNALETLLAKLARVSTVANDLLA
mmetsp:Transcript_14767/g.25576  ORF Transcript_14767/g.25576 Transcript_14767/m.25576 type:complete len:125 (+) Transcript_14767:137-511(+)